MKNAVLVLKTRKIIVKCTVYIFRLGMLLGIVLLSKQTRLGENNTFRHVHVHTVEPLPKCSEAML